MQHLGIYDFSPLFVSCGKLFNFNYSVCGANNHWGKI